MLNLSSLKWLFDLVSFSSNRGYSTSLHMFHSFSFHVSMEKLSKHHVLHVYKCMYQREAPLGNSQTLVHCIITHYLKSHSPCFVYSWLNKESN